MGTEASPVTIEDGELVFGHDIRCWLHLDAVPNLLEGAFQYGVDRRRDLSILAGPDDFESPRHGELIENPPVWRSAAHGVVEQWH